MKLVMAIVKPFKLMQAVRIHTGDRNDEAL